MTISQFFVYKRPVAWSLLVVTVVWGLYSYSQMPQRQDPQIQIRSGVIITPYPGANPTEVEQQVTRKIEKKMTENPSVERVNSISRQGQSVVFVTLFDTVKNAEPVWQDLAAKLDVIDDLPAVAGQSLKPKLDKDFGDTVAVMLTLSSPPVSDFEIDERARTIGAAVTAARKDRAGPRLSGVLVHPAGVPADFVERMGRSTLRALTEAGIAIDTQYVATLGAGILDFQLSAGKTEADARAAIEAWERVTVGSGTGHPDVWPGVLIADPAQLGPALKQRVRSVPGGVARYSFKQMRDYADLIQDRLRQSKFVGRIDQLGTQDEAVFLYYSNRKLTELGLDPSVINSRLAARNINLPGGQVELPGQTLAVKPSGEFKSEAELGGVPLDARPGYPLYLRDVAEVVRGYEDPPRQLHYRTLKGDEQPGPRRAVTLAVRHIKGTQIAEFDADVAARLDALKAELPDDLRLERTSNEPAQVAKKIDQFTDCLIEAILIVVVVALVFMEWRSALLVAASIPLAVAMTLGMCHLIGIDIQQISIAALIIALGLLVDDPVVASDAINRELAEGQPRDVAAWLGPQKLARAILYATVTNIVAFLPMLLITGGPGEFVYSLPVVVTASLIASRIVSMTFMPLLGYYILRGQKSLAGVHPNERRGFARLYTRVSRFCIENRWLALFAATAALFTALSLVPLIGSAFFPKDLHNVFSVNLFLPEGASIRETAAEAERLTRLIDAEAGDEVTAYTTFVGQGGPRFWLSVVPEQPAPNYAQILVHTKDAHRTAALANRLKLALPPHATGRLTVEVLESGPPVGVPVQIRVYGADIAALRRLGAQVKGVMRSIPGTDNIHDDWDPDALQFGLRVRPDRAAVCGVTNEDVAAVTQAGLSGTATTYLRERDRLIPIALRLRPDERARTEDLANLTVFNSQSGSKVPLDQVSEFKLEAIPPKVLRRDNERCMTIKCDALPGTLPSAVVDEVERKLKPLSAEWPAGYRFAVGGEKEEQQKGFKSIATAGLVSMLAIYLALVVQFNSLTKPLLVYAAVPFGMVGGLMGLFAFNVPLGFFAGLGLSSLMGVIVSHVIVLFEYIEEAHEKGEPVREAVVDAGLARLRPVLVTVLATVGGLIPLALKGGPLWEPLCYVQIIGLLVATVVTLLLVPLLYVVFVEDLGLVRWDPPGTHKYGPPLLDKHGLPNNIDDHREWRHRRKDGSTFDAEVPATTMPDGSLLSMIGDISERKRVERAAAESSETLEAIFDNVPVMLCFSDAADRIQMVNRAFERVFGWTSEQILAHPNPLEEWYPDPEYREQVMAFVHSGEGKFAEFRIRTRSGKVIAANFANVLLSDGRRIGIGMDVTEQRQLERQLQQAQKMEAVGILAGGVAHDFNNLLTVINGYGELLIDQLEINDPHLPLLQEIRHAGERATTLTRQLLAFSRQQILDPKVFNLNNVVADADKLLRRLIGEDVILTTSLSRNLGLVKADPGQIEQVLINLAVNARDAMPRGGQLTIETKGVHLDETYCRAYADLFPGDYILMAVSDTGTGMDEATQARIFEPFFTTKDTGKGTGLGLSTVHGIVKQSRGHIAVYSEVGRGTTFKVYLPQVDESPTPSRSHQQSQAMPRGTETILLVEDEDSVRQFGKQILNSCGYTVFEASNGLEAVNMMKANAEPIHLVISDVVMPHLSGRELAARVHEIRPATHVLFVSGYTDDAIIRHGVLSPDFAFLQKPFTPSSLAQKVRGILDQ